MRLTPSQCGMYLLLGHRHPKMPPDEPLADCIRLGRALLVDDAGVDLGYDPWAWDTHLRATDTDAGGYRWSNKHRPFPALIRKALADAAWRAAVASLGGPVPPPPRRPWWRFWG